MPLLQVKRLQNLCNKQRGELHEYHTAEQKALKVCLVSICASVGQHPTPSPVSEHCYLHLTLSLSPSRHAHHPRSWDPQFQKPDVKYVLKGGAAAAQKHYMDPNIKVNLEP